MKVIPLKCPNCGAGIEVPEGIETLVCTRCGTQSTVERGAGYVSLKKLEEIQEVTGKVASELAIGRLREEITILEAERAALGKKIKEVKQQLYEKRRRPGVVLVGIVMLIVVIPFLYLVFTLEGMRMYACAGVVLPGGVLLVFWLDDRGRSVARSWLMKQQEKFQQELAAKEEEAAAKGQELEEHQRAVGG